MNGLQVFKYNDIDLRTVEKEDGLWWVLADVCRVLDLGSPHKVAERLDTDERGRNQIPTPGGNQEMTIINEPGLYNVILRSDKPEAKDFKRWVTHEVLPSIRKHGGYVVNMTAYQQMMAQTRAENARIRKAQILTRLADKYEGTTYQQVLNAHATKELTGEYLLPLPKLEAKTYSASEIGGILGISGHMVGILTNRHGLKTDQYGAWFNDKAKSSTKEVQSFRYYETVIPVLRALMEKIA